MRTWPVHDAKARFNELLEASRKDGPQVVTELGVEAAVLVAAGEWRRLQGAARPSLKALLLADAPLAHIPVPRRGRRRRPTAG